MMAAWAWAGGDGDTEKGADVVMFMQHPVLCLTGRSPLNDRSCCNSLYLKHLTFPSQDEVKFLKWLFL